MKTEERSPSYRPEIDGLRALAVSVVVLGHYGAPGLAGGFVGVDIFFVLSGFLITRLILDQRARGRFSYLDFYLRRARRILPALIVMLAVSTALAAVLLLPQDLARFGQSLWAASLGVSNILFWRQAGYFAPGAASMPLLHAWSLGVEEQFYLLFPVLLVVCLRCGRRVALIGMALIALLSLVLCEVILPAHGEAAFYLLPPRAWELLLGAGLAFGPAEPGRRWLAQLAGLAGLAAVVLSIMRLTPESRFPGLAAAPAAVGTAALLWAGPQTWSGRFLRLPPMIAIGKISYSLYLWHWPLLVFGGYYALTGLTTGARAALLLAAVALAGLSWRFVEQPIRRGRGATGRLAAIAACSLCGLVAAGGLLSLTRGLPGRFPPAVEAMMRPAPPLVACPDGRSATSGDRVEAISCPLGPVEQVPRFIVWGDSHAMALSAAFQAAALRRAAPGLLIARTGCAPLLGVTWPARPACRDFNRAAVEKALAPGVEQVFLVARWAVHAEGTRFGDDGGNLVLTFPGVANSNHAAFSAGLAATVERLRAAGKQVVFVDAVPELPRSAPETLAKAMVMGRRYNPGISRAAYRDRQAFTQMTARNLSQRLGMKILPTEQVFCPLENCKVELDGASLYRDNHHLSPSGAAQMVDLVADALDTSGVPAPPLLVR